MFVFPRTVKGKHSGIPRDLLDLSFVGFVPRLSPLVKIIVMNRGVSSLEQTKGSCVPCVGSYVGEARGLWRLTESYLQTEEHLFVAEVRKETWTPSRASGMLRPAFHVVMVCSTTLLVAQAT